MPTSNHANQEDTIQAIAPTFEESAYKQLQAAIDNLISRMGYVESRLLCVCGAIQRANPNNPNILAGQPITSTQLIHEAFCPLYTPSTTRLRDCYNCGTTGLIQAGSNIVGCAVCNGTGKVPEKWEDGKLVW